MERTVKEVVHVKNTRGKRIAEVADEAPSCREIKMHKRQLVRQ